MNQGSNPPSGGQPGGKGRRRRRGRRGPAAHGAAPQHGRPQGQGQGPAQGQGQGQGQGPGRNQNPRRFGKKRPPGDANPGAVPASVSPSAEASTPLPWTTAIAPRRATTTATRTIPTWGAAPSLSANSSRFPSLSRWQLSATLLREFMHLSTTSSSSPRSRKRRAR